MARKVFLSPRLCKVCREKMVQYRGMCRLCCRAAGIYDSREHRRYTGRDPEPPATPKLEALIQPEAPREITAHDREYVVFWSGGQSLYGSETPRHFGSSLLDSSRIVK